uniref:Uncharacterized protein n=1 Tax=Chromera velia CCMP2878 TaxID=1169474 RepID=A0A0G4IBY7_9ALVE|eukprot:Cvel_12960.t1-p1 / transcript=Cvel_12960.t1 / gene=Cvel_12960 / organism=Chromera_velia_CCMP2878 / gene_product=hypothetical protein / transcript_product=hypothetical protein / location=Cvel_scaffold867:50772-53356(+) / protein_length=165 / sequence_SO=supercontig / SO=protein_coding / is_pseudo=false
MSINQARDETVNRRDGKRKREWEADPEADCEHGARVARIWNSVRERVHDLQGGVTGTLCIPRHDAGLLGSLQACFIDLELIIGGYQEEEAEDGSEEVEHENSEEGEGDEGKAHLEEGGGGIEGGDLKEGKLLGHSGRIEEGGEEPVAVEASSVGGGEPAGESAVK